ncbi:ABC transporter ATP-binding protein [Actinacidiphila soli]|uniref:ABC transporter ATP-binding protein n=1 Tax=Actinacidiphila soli TaxID=2487275 RepID=UPI000FCADD5E|nr:ABC transporter ATP-binding protein [Actinacidiphila soli]
MTEPVIELSGVNRHFIDGPAALRDVSLTVHAGEAVAILGPSGSGKSTMLNMIAGLDRPDSGTVTVAGVRVDKLNEAGAARYRRNKIGMIFQFFNLLDDLTVLDNVVLPAEMTGMARGEARKHATGLLETLGIAKHVRAYPGRLSGGERQRVAVARALMNHPALLLADEPTGALDSASGEEVKALLRELHADGQTIVMVTHDLTLAQTCATRTVRIVDGQIASDTRTHPPAADTRVEVAR